MAFIRCELEELGRRLKAEEIVSSAKERGIENLFLVKTDYRFSIEEEEVSLGTVVRRWSVKELSPDQLLEDLKGVFCGDSVLEREFIVLDSQNLDVEGLPEEAIIRFTDDGCGIVTRGESIKHYYLLIHGRWLTPSHEGDHWGRGRVFQTPDGKKFLVRGKRGDPYTTSSMWFQSLSEEDFDVLVARRKEEKRQAEAAVAEARAREEAEKERRYLRYRASIRGLTEGLGLHILVRCNTASGMPAPYMVCQEIGEERDLRVMASFCSQEGTYAFLRSILIFVRRQFGGGQLSREAWEEFDASPENLAKALAFANAESEKAALRKRRCGEDC